MKIVYKLFKKWSSYKYRFLPWIAFGINPGKHISIVKDEIIEREEVLGQLTSIFSYFKHVESSKQNSNAILEEVAGFQITCRQSEIPGAGNGVFVSSGSVKKGQVVAIYPGTVYLPSDFIFFQSLANQFIFRCKDHHYIDGKRSGLSKSIFKSCAGRDKVGYHNTCDCSWLTGSLSCPLNVGQYVNNKTSIHLPNIQYQEFDFMSDFPLEFRKFVPNINHGGLGATNYLRTVVLVATTDISTGQELIGEYFTASN
ncbi:SET domain-containing protein 9-like [Clavelina lepadiformis]|uniref:SET domain-containing protein 9-like n=1 Tax=Clavelina lepadiformis TaxID=159417 RepID=UPI0040432691